MPSPIATSHMESEYGFDIHFWDLSAPGAGREGDEAVPQGRALLTRRMRHRKKRNFASGDNTERRGSRSSPALNGGVQFCARKQKVKRIYGRVPRGSVLPRRLLFLLANSPSGRAGITGETCLPFARAPRAARQPSQQPPITPSRFRDSRGHPRPAQLVSHHGPTFQR